MIKQHHFCFYARLILGDQLLCIFPRSSFQIWSLLSAKLELNSETECPTTLFCLPVTPFHICNFLHIIFIQ
ncbi:hypothetical protein T06_7579 [Trichinella sp. T6]|nr:hypothetical protein T06_7579 [Trichinella sp. T6]